MTPRDAVPADLAGIARLHLESWRRHYVGLLPSAILDERAPAEIAALWRPARLATHRVAVLEDEGGLIGFSACDPGHPGGPFLDNLHVRAGAQGAGHGRRLLSALARSLLQDGRHRLWCLVIDGNPALAFYKHCGGVPGAIRAVELLGHRIREREVVWETLAALAATAPGPIPGAPDDRA